MKRNEKQAIKIEVQGQRLADSFYASAISVLAQGQKHVSFSEYCKRYEHNTPSVESLTDSQWKRVVEQARYILLRKVNR